MLEAFPPTSFFSTKQQLSAAMKHQQQLIATRKPRQIS